MKKNNSVSLAPAAGFRMRSVSVCLMCFPIFFFCVSAAIGDGQEPVYKGRALSEWLGEMRIGQLYFPDPSKEGIIGLGTNALPKLLEWISYERLPEKGLVWAERTNAPAKPTAIVKLSADELADRSMYAFRYLGSVARPAIPELTRLARTSSDSARAYRCTEALASIGPEAIPSLLSLATNGPPMTRWYAIAALEYFDLAREKAAEQAVPVLIMCLDDPKDEVGNKAANILSTIDLPIVVPALTNALQSPSARTRYWAARCLWWKGAREAIPILHTALRDPNYEVRAAASEILRDWAPELVTNVPSTLKKKAKGR